MRMYQLWRRAYVITRLDTAGTWERWAVVARDANGARALVSRMYGVAWDELGVRVVSGWAPITVTPRMTVDEMCGFATAGRPR